MTRIPGSRFLHSPGPTHIPEEVLNAMHRQPMDHGDPRLDQVIAAIDGGLGPQTGRGGMEMAIASLGK